MSRSSRHAIVAGAFALLLTAVSGQSQAAAHKPVPFDKTASLVRRGYVEISGNEAVKFLVGNSILVRSSDAPPGYEETDHNYYFLDSRLVYDCYNRDCSLDPWKLVDGRLCLQPVGCEELSFKQLQSPTLLRAPRRRGGHDLGIYLEYGRFMHRIVRGRPPDVPLFDPNGSGVRMQFDRADLASAIGDQPLDDGQRAYMRGPRTTSLRIGNTFATDEMVKDTSGHDHWCPDQGRYYSPDGWIVVFNCHGENGRTYWAFMTLHWKMDGDKLCQEDPVSGMQFGCREIPLFAVLAKDSDKLVVSEDNYPPNVLVYSGNVFNFHLKDRHDR